jgi:hypothetical protein
VLSTKVKAHQKILASYSAFSQEIERGGNIFKGVPVSLIFNARSFHQQAKKLRETLTSTVL